MTQKPLSFPRVLSFVSVHHPSMNRVHIALFALLFFCMTYAHQKKFDSPTPVSRLDLLHALFVQGTVRIDAYHENTPDKAVFEGSYYSDKAPGTVVLALLPFALASVVLAGAGVSLDSGFGWLFSSWVACAGSIGIVTALGGVALFRWVRKFVPPRSALVVVLALFLGAAPLPYATMMFSHALVIGLLALAIWAMDQQGGVDGAQTTQARPIGFENEKRFEKTGRWLRSNRWDLLAGLACGWALASEHSAGLVVAGLFIWLLSMGWRRAVPFCVAAIPPLMLIPAYSWACFGDPFTLPYSHQAAFPAMKEGLYAIKWPDAETGINLLISPARGLFFWTPFLGLAVFGYWRLMQVSPQLFWLTYAVPVLHIVVISGRTWDWPAGPTLGPRLLAPMLPLLALPCAFGAQKFPRLGLALAVYSIAITTLAALTNACPPFNTHPNPLFDLHIPLFSEGKLSPNLGTAMGLPPRASAALFYVVLAGGACWLWRTLGCEAQTPGRLKDRESAQRSSA